MEQLKLPPKIRKRGRPKGSEESHWTAKKEKVWKKTLPLLKSFLWIEIKVQCIVQLTVGHICYNSNVGTVW